MHASGKRDETFNADLKLTLVVEMTAPKLAAYCGTVEEADIDSLTTGIRAGWPVNAYTRLKLTTTCATLRCRAQAFLAAQP